LDTTAGLSAAILAGAGLAEADIGEGAAAVAGLAGLSGTSPSADALEIEILVIGYNRLDKLKRYKPLMLSR
jgi:hypothetical protein